MTELSNPPVHRPRPAPDLVSAPFWAAANQGELVIQRCGRCGIYQHPPAPLCGACLSTELSFEPMTGEATVYSFTETHAGARHPYFAATAPYRVGLVELAEQPGLLMYTNFPGAELRDLRVGAAARVVFEPIGDDIALPQFAVVGHSGGAA